jgi:hypothetical protein
MMTRAKVKRWMWDWVEDYVDGCGEVKCTELAENAAWNCGSDSWLDDPDHFVWELAVEVSVEYAERGGK